MEIKTYKCDKCKHTVATVKDLVSIEITAKPEKYVAGSYRTLQLDICSACAEKVGVIKRVIKGDEITKEVPDLKELVERLPPKPLF